MEKVKKIVLIGASGFVGSALLNEALNRGFEVTAVVRHPEKIKIENENLKVVKADVAVLDEVADVCKGADAIVSAFNPGWNNPDIYDETIKVYLTIIDGVKKAGVNRFLMVDIDTGYNMCYLSVNPGKCCAEYPEPTFVERALVIPGVNFSR